MCPTVKGGFFPSEFKNLTTITFLKKHLKKAEIFPLVYPAMRIILFVQVLGYPCLRLVSRQIKPKPSASPQERVRICVFGFFVLQFG